MTPLLKYDYNICNICFSHSVRIILNLIQEGWNTKSLSNILLGFLISDYGEYLFSQSFFMLLFSICLSFSSSKVPFIYSLYTLLHIEIINN